ncbi:hypothetical protein TWF694_005774 [Orbilia ellipsospora]|uniref:F-box domain-containing protein n=1 Tax=Orbilia ellipsospora TaxID=2528407 RepID=A0AAV9WSY7_9PEZI
MADWFDKIPYLNTYPLETSFPYLTPDFSSQRSRNTTLACTRIAILGSLKASRLQGVGSLQSTPARSYSSQFLSTTNSRSVLKPYRQQQPPPPPPLSQAESNLVYLFTNYITQSILLQHLTTYDLIALRQTSPSLRRILDREHTLWRTVNISNPRLSIPKTTPKRCHRTDITCNPTTLLRYLTKIANNHLANTPISPYHHIRVLILDNFNFHYSYQHHIIDMLNLLFENPCLAEHLKMLSIRGFWDLDIAHITNFLRDREIGIRGEFRNLGWKYTDSDNGEEGVTVTDRAGKVVPTETWKKKRGWNLEVFRFAGPGLFAGKETPYPTNTVALPVNVPSFLHIPVDKIEEDGEGNGGYYGGYKEVFLTAPVHSWDDYNGGKLVRAMKSAERLGVKIDVGFCKNEEAHVSLDSWSGRRLWGVCEKRWERCVLPGCRWAGWTQTCGNCRWRGGNCCRGCYGWICEGCKNMGKGTFGPGDFWCGSKSRECAAVGPEICLDL